ncbi:MAG: hypothetical protein AAB613_01090 [Patescibacteria group bacterium]
MAERGREGLSKFEVQPEKTGEQPVHPETIEQPEIIPSPTATPDNAPSEISTPKDILPEARANKQNGSPDFDHLVAPGEQDPVDLQAKLSWEDTESIGHLDG